MGNLLNGLTPIMYVDIDFRSDVHAVDGCNMGLLQQTRDIISALENYKGCGDSIKKAINNSTDISLQRKGFDDVAPNIQLVSGFHATSAAVADAIHEVSSRLTDLQSFQSNPARVQLLGELLLFCFSFDQIKMLKPDIQNDFSFYRRSLGSKSLANAPQPITPDTANVVSMWLAQNMPMTCSVRRETSAFAVGNLANLCCGMIARDACQDPIATAKVLRIMVAAAIVYDRISRTGVFCSQSIVKIRKVIKTIAIAAGQDRTNLGNSLKYSTVHYNDATTPPNVRSDLEKL